MSLKKLSKATYDGTKGLYSTKGGKAKKKYSGGLAKTGYNQPRVL